MSVENLKEYARRCATEPEMRQAAKDIGLQDIDQHIGIAESLGLEWDRRDLADFRKELTEGDELSDVDEEELEKIVGGICTITAVVIAGLAVGGAVGAGAGVAIAGAAGGVVAATGSNPW